MATDLRNDTKASPAQRAAPWLFGLFLIVATVFAYSPALHGQFLWDDNAWTKDIAKLLKDTSGLASMWSNPTALQQYYPLTGSSFWVDNHFWKSWTFPYHVENVCLHLAAVFLFWRLLYQLRVPGAWLAAGLFALHPMMTESVAWITERKNVLSMVFFLGALLAYGRSVSFWKEDKAAPRRWGAYALAFFLLVAALLAKTTTFSFPAVVLLICWWKQGRLQWRKDILPSLLFFAVAISFSAGTAWLEKNHVGAEGPEWAISFPERCEIAGRAFWFYLGKLFWPENLCFIYPRWKPDVNVWWQWLLPLAAVGVVFALWKFRGKLGRSPLTTALYFLGTIFPVLGFLNAYGMRYSFVWDHWVYLSSLGIFALAAGLIASATRSRPQLLFGTAVVLLPLLAFLTWKQTAMYVDSETLWRTTIAKNPDAFLAYNNLGYLLMEKNQLAESIPYFQKSIRVNPGFSEPHNNMGDALIRTGHTNEGMAEFRRALELISSTPSTAAASYYNYGNAWLETGHPEDAVPYFKKALELFPGFAKAYNNLGCALLRTGQTNEAVDAFQKAIDNDPDMSDAHNNLGNELLLRGQTEEAMEHFRKAIQIRPDFQEPFNTLIGLQVSQGKADAAVATYEQVLRVHDTADLRNDLANLLVRQKRTDEAIVQYQTAIKMKPQNGEFDYNLGVAFTLKKQMNEAANSFQRAADLMTNSAPPHYRLGLVDELQKKFGPAIAEYQKALDLNPNYLSARNNLAWMLATCPDGSLRDGKQALKLAQEVGRSSNGITPQFLDTLAAAYAEAGQFPEAVISIKRAVGLADKQGDLALVESLRSREKLYEANAAYHEQP